LHACLSQFWAGLKLLKTSYNEIACDFQLVLVFFGYDRLYSATAILSDLQLPSFDALMYNYKFSFSVQLTCRPSGNAVVKYLVSIGM